jgi:hypothetical protein
MLRKTMRIPIIELEEKEGNKRVNTEMCRYFGAFPYDDPVDIVRS